MENAPAVTRIHPRLPVFRLEDGERRVLYAPGHLAVVPPGPVGPALEAELQRRAEDAVREWDRRLAAPFEPECLTLHPADRCNLACAYCCSPAGNEGPIDGRMARAAARRVARCCAGKGKPFHLVLHGGGEPTLHWDRVRDLVAETRGLADEAGIGWFGYIATNGVLPEERARWLAGHFDLVGLSCDGPPDIQDRQRPLAGGGASSSRIERTARAISDAGGRFVVRATVVPGTVDRQAEIVAYAHDRLGAAEVRLEPVFRTPGGFIAEDAGRFVSGFLAARREARTRGCRLSFSGSRLDEIHGPFCDTLRDVFRLMADGSVAPCFLGGESVGKWDPALQDFVLDAERIAAHRLRTGLIPDRCRDCVNAYHCARECPEACTVNGAPGFRCLVQRRLAETWILEAAAPAHLLAGAPPSVDAGPILRQWNAAKSRIGSRRRSLPSPIWARRGFEHDGAEAWRRLSSYGGGGPISAYVHVPFCDRRCGFCDCRSQVLGRHAEETYAGALLDEMDAWGRIEALCRRPVTTVHFGGGTPGALSPSVFARILDRFRSRFAVTSRTEWAIESTSSLLTDEHLTWLREHGFTRLHVGVQTLEEPLRARIGRRESSPIVLEKLTRVLGMGFVVSVDLVYGLPGQTLASLLGSLDRLVDVGVHGFSLYQLQVSERNRRFLERLGALDRDPLADYLLLQVAEQVLVRRGYRKTHFTHLARPEDANVYYGYPLRGEDLLALGPTADGVFGSYWYRHPEYAAYVGGSAPCLEGGVRESETERALRPAVAALMAGRMRRELLRPSDIESWLESGLIEEDPARGEFVLTANGTWFVTEMLEQLSRT